MIIGAAGNTLSPFVDVGSTDLAPEAPFVAAASSSPLRSDPGWARTARRGVRVLLWTALVAPLATGIFAFTLRVVVPGLADRGADLSAVASAVEALPWLAIGVGLLQLVGVALLTAPPPWEQAPRARLARLAAKPLALLWWVAALGEAASGLTGFRLPPLLPTVSFAAWTLGALAVLVVIADVHGHLGRVGPRIASLIMAWYAAGLVLLELVVTPLEGAREWEATREVLSSARLALGLVTTLGACVVLAWASRGLRAAQGAGPAQDPQEPSGDGVDAAEAVEARQGVDQLDAPE